MADNGCTTILADPVDAVARDLRIPDAELDPAEYRRRRLLRFTGELHVTGELPACEPGGALIRP